MTAAIHELTYSIAAMQSYLTSQQPLPSPPCPPPPPPSPQLAMASLPPVFHVGMPQSSTTGVPIHLLWMPPSPSPIPSYALAPTVGPVYTMATFPATTTLAAPAPTTGALIHYGGAVQQPSYTEGLFYGGIDGPLLYGGNMQHHPGASSSVAFDLEPAAPGVSHGAHPLRFYKLEFPTYDGAEDPLN